MTFDDYEKIVSTYGSGSPAALDAFRSTVLTSLKPLKAPVHIDETGSAIITLKYRATFKHKKIHLQIY